MALINVNHVTKRFRPRDSRTLLMRGGLANLFTPRRQPVTALRDISFTVERGESIGLIGANGSGKSTLLKVIAGVTVPSEGEVTVHGRVVSLLELGTGFHPVLSGRENIYLNGRLLGMSRAEVAAAFDDIVDFAGIGEYLDYPVNTYSSGMYVRLGFAVAAHANPDIFLVDEVLAVGDEEFQRKCRKRLGELLQQGKTFIFVSHDLNIVNTLCDRVILLARGEMITRPSPRETIDFYLRQVGREKGIHRFQAGPLEAVFNHGRLSLFRGQHEITGTSGLHVRTQAMGQQHYSFEADWEVVERRENGCTARGRMMRLPLVQQWDMELDEHRLRWRLGLDCEREAQVEEVTAALSIPETYTRWVYGDIEGRFPPIMPSDVESAVVVSARPEYLATAAWAEEQDSHPGSPPLLVTCEPRQFQSQLNWLNSDRMQGCRVLQSFATVPAGERPLAPGSFDAMELEVTPTFDRRSIEARFAESREQRTLRHGAFSARFVRGTLPLAWEETELTTFLHVYSSALIGNLWNDTCQMRWESVDKTENVIEAAGVSRRFPYRQEWRFEMTPEGLAMTAWLEALEPFEMQEYQVSVCLRAEYERWQTEHEEGVYPAFDPAQTDWVHVNRDYAPGSCITALSSALPSVRLGVTAGQLAFRMTAINTDYGLQTRVIQALRTATHGTLRFDKGRHLYFQGLVSVGRNDGGNSARTDEAP